MKPELEKVLIRVFRFGVVLAVAWLGSQDSRAQTGPYTVGQLQGSGNDAGDYSGFNCFDSDNYMPIPKSGSVLIERHNDGSVTGYQQVDPEVCITADHPRGAKFAVFKVYDHNPKVSPGFAVKEK